MTDPSAKPARRRPDRPTEQFCPVCGRAVQVNMRYRRYVCGACAGRAKAADGRPPVFYNIDAWGGYDARYADTDEPYPSHECFIDGITCRAGEARFGGIVIQAVDEAPTE